MVDKNMSLFMTPGMNEVWRQSFEEAKDPNLQKLAETGFVIPDSWAEFDELAIKGSLKNY